jgi:hypothetical protein
MECKRMEYYLQSKLKSYCEEYSEKVMKELEKVKRRIEEEQTGEELIKVLREVKEKCMSMNIPEVKREDLVRKRRTRHIVPESELCMAKCLGGERCSRRKQKESIYCGTHSKWQPSGVLSEIVNSEEVKNNEGIEKTGKKNTRTVNIYPVNENGIIKLYSDIKLKELKDANEVMKCRV